jgi:hypothetical protein
LKTLVFLGSGYGLKTFLQGHSEKIGGDVEAPRGGFSPTRYCRIENGVVLEARIGGWELLLPNESGYTERFAQVVQMPLFCPVFVGVIVAPTQRVCQNGVVEFQANQ